MLEQVPDDDLLTRCPQGCNPGVKAALHTMLNADGKEAADLRSTSSRRPTAPSTRKAVDAVLEDRAELAGALRLPGRAPGPYSDHQRRHGQAANQHDEGMYLAVGQRNWQWLTSCWTLPRRAGAASMHPTWRRLVGLGRRSLWPVAR